MAAKAEKGEPLDRIEKLVKTIGAVVAGVVALNAGVTAFMTESVSRAHSFRNAVASEEAYWRGLYQDYLATFDKEISSDTPRRRAHYQAIKALSNHPVPLFDEYAFFVRDDVRLAARERLNQIRADLHNTLLDPKTGLGGVVEEGQEQVFLQEQAAVQARPGNREALRATPETTSVPLAVNVSASHVDYATRVLAGGKSNGWDIDIFWCQGQGEEAYFAKAVTVAKALAQRSSSGDRLGGEILGRVRLRSLPKRLQLLPQYAPRGPIVVADNAAEDALAGAVIQLLVAEKAPISLRPVRGQSASAWYLSVFICPQSPGPAPLPAPAA